MEAASSSTPCTPRYEPISVPPDTVESVLALRLKNEKRQEFIDAYRSVKPPDTYPALSRVLVGRDDTIVNLRYRVLSRSYGDSANLAVTEKRMIVAGQFADESRAEAELASAKTANAKATAVNEDMKRSTGVLVDEMKRSTGGTQ